MEQKKLLWVIFSAVGFVLIVAVVGLVLFWPEGEKMGIEKESIKTAVDREFDPIEWVREDEEYPGIEEQEVCVAQLGIQQIANGVGKLVGCAFPQVLGHPSSIAIDQ